MFILLIHLPINVFIIYRIINSEGLFKINQSNNRREVILCLVKMRLCKN